MTMISAETQPLVSYPLFGASFAGFNDDMNRTVQTLVAMAFFLAFSGAPEGLAARYVSPDWENRLAILIAVAFGAGGFVAALIRGPERYGRALLAGWPVLSLALLCGISMIWSAIPSDTLMSAFQMGMLTLAGVSLAAMADWRALLMGAALAMTALGAVSVLLIPLDGIMTEIHPGALRGPWGEKNEAGLAFALGGLACTATGFATRNFRWLALAGFMLILLVATTSTTSALACGVTIALLVAIETLRRGPMRLLFGGWLAAVAVTIAVFAVMFNAEDLLSVAGKDNTLTGRSDIWPSVIRRIEASPWKGYGYDAFWRETNASMLWLWEEINFEAQNAHNGWLETWLNVGIMGPLLLAWAVLRTLTTGVSNIYGTPDLRRFGLPLVILFLITSLSESVLGGPDGLIWFSFIVFTTKAAMGPAPKRTA